MIISKELLSKVLGIDTINDYEFDGNLITIYYIDDENRKDYGLINVHELDYKCKQWAWENGFEIMEDASRVRAISLDMGTYIEDFGRKKYNIEANFTAYEWILEQKAKS